MVGCIGGGRGGGDIERKGERKKERGEGGRKRRENTTDHDTQSLTVFNQLTLLYIDTPFYLLCLRAAESSSSPVILSPTQQVASSSECIPHPSTPVMSSSPSIPVSHTMHGIPREILRFVHSTRKHPPLFFPDKSQPRLFWYTSYTQPQPTTIVPLTPWS